MCDARHHFKAGGFWQFLFVPTRLAIVGNSASRQGAKTPTWFPAIRSIQALHPGVRFLRQGPGFLIFEESAILG
jgi:hypothetical protein